jgi:hypothetical protein
VVFFLNNQLWAIVTRDQQGISLSRQKRAKERAQDPQNFEDSAPSNTELIIAVSLPSLSELTT